MDRATFDKIGEALEAAAQAVAEKYNVHFGGRTGSWRFDGMRISFDFKESSDNIHQMKCTEHEEFERLAPLVGLKAEDYNRIIPFRGTNYRIVAVKPSRPRFPVTVERVRDGKRFKMTSYQIQHPHESSFEEVM